ncbi:MAG: Uma2 family endonuclease [Planctomycetota bacterium]|jgi:Uma2 family endonuclease
MQDLFTREDYDRLPEGFPAQLVGGQLVKEPAPTYGHQRIASRIHASLLPLVGPDRVLESPVDVGIDDHNVYQPDLVVLETLPPLDRSDVGIPLLAIEILSPVSERRDRRIKTPRLLRAGVGEVWLVDPRHRTIEVHAPATCRTARGPEPARSSVLSGFELVPEELFALPNPPVEDA